MSPQNSIETGLSAAPHPLADFQFEQVVFEGPLIAGCVGKALSLLLQDSSLEHRVPLGVSPRDMRRLAEVLDLEIIDSPAAGAELEGEIADGTPLIVVYRTGNNLSHAEFTRRVSAFDDEEAYPDVHAIIRRKPNRPAITAQDGSAGPSTEV